MLGFISLFKIHQFFDQKFSKARSWAILFVIFILCGFGIYLGRYERWNSWDIILNPSGLLAGVLQKIFHPFQHKEAIAATVLFSAFLFCNYLTLFALVKSVKNENN
jgi:uncharacterized membrane protein